MAVPFASKRKRTGQGRLGALRTWLKRRPSYIAPLLGVGLFLLLVLGAALWSAPRQGSSVVRAPDTPALNKLEKANPGLPARLKIPSINVNASVDYVGLTRRGDMGIPTGPARVAWYNRGPRPGQAGSAVIAGHFGWVGNTPAAFDNLHKLKPGDKLYVVDKKGVITTFVVRKLKKYDPSAEASSVFGSTDGKRHLNLVTCEGVWDQASNNYAKRLVAFADQE